MTFKKFLALSQKTRDGLPFINNTRMSMHCFKKGGISRDCIAYTYLKDSLMVFANKKKSSSSPHIN